MAESYHIQREFVIRRLVHSFRSEDLSEHFPAFDCKSPAVFVDPLFTPKPLAEIKSYMKEMRQNRIEAYRHESDLAQC